MPYYIKTKFSFKCPVVAKDKKDVEHSLSNKLSYVELKHSESLISTWIFPSDCVKGELTLTLEGSAVIVQGDFTAKTKFKSSDIAEFSEAGGGWVFSGMSVKRPDRTSFSLDTGADTKPSVAVEITDKK
jgi:hypothetical protein